MNFGEGAATANVRALPLIGQLGDLDPGKVVDRLLEMGHGAGLLDGNQPGTAASQLAGNRWQMYMRNKTTGLVRVVKEL